jgi:hypothetical protein
VLKPRYTHTTDVHFGERDIDFIVGVASSKCIEVLIEVGVVVLVRGGLRC